MAGGKDAGPCSGAVKEVVYEYRIRLLGIFCILIFLLFRKSMGIQPVNQLHVHPQSPKGVLGSMDMKVNKPRNDQFLPVVHTGNPFPFLREGLKDSQAFSVFAYCIPMLCGPYFVLIFTVTDMASDGKSFHGIFSLLIFKFSVPRQRGYSLSLSFVVGDAFRFRRSGVP